MSAKVIFDLDSDKGGRQNFDTVAEAIVWARAQADSWRRFLDHGNNRASANLAFLQTRFERAAEELQAAMKPVNGAAEYPIIYSDQEFIATESVVGRVIAMITNSMGFISGGAAAAAAGVAQEGINWSNEHSIAGVVMLRHYVAEARELQHGSETRQVSSAMFALQEDLKRAQFEIDAISKHSEALTDQAKKNSEAMIAAVQVKENLFAVALETAERQAADRFKVVETHLSGHYASLEELRGAYSSALSDASFGLEKLRDEQSSALEAWQATQREQLKLQPPAKLWVDRAATHRSSAKRAAIVATCVGGVGFALTAGVAFGAFEFAGWLLTGAEVDNFVGLAGEAERQLRQQAAVRLARSAGATPSLRPTFHAELIFAAATTLLWLTMYVWTMRVLVKVYTTEHHLAINASGRAAMVETYLGLMSSEAANVGDRPIVLGAIFQPISDGFVNDDGPPQMSIPAIVATLAAGKTGGAGGATT